MSFCCRNGFIFRALPVVSFSGSVRVAVGRKRGGGISGSRVLLFFRSLGTEGGGDDGGEE